MAEMRPITFFDETNMAASANSDSWDIDRMTSAVFSLSVTACAGGLDTLDVKIQDSVDGSVWYDLVTFTQATAATTERKTSSGPFGQYMRAVATLGAGTTASFSLKATLHGT